MEDQKKTGSRNVFVTVVGVINIAVILANVVVIIIKFRDFNIAYVDNGMILVALILLITAIGLFMHNRFGRIMAVITGVLFLLTGMFGFGQFGKGRPDWHVLASIALGITIAILNFMAGSRLAAKMSDSKVT